MIEDGSWAEDTPYGVIHRIAAKIGAKGVVKEAVDFGLTKINHLRIDTHRDNLVMQHVLQKYGFSRRGIIYIADGTPRIAYERI